jgi:hypothetical protein
MYPALEGLFLLQSFPRWRVQVSGLYLRRQIIVLFDLDQFTLQTHHI